jgi:hypothetical protein
MAINRTMMKRQMYRGGGLGVVPREQYGLGSFLKKTFKKITKPFVKVAQKLVPKEIAKPLMVAAPFLGPYAPLIYAAGSAKATGGIDPMKLALTAAPYVKFEGIKPVGYGGSKYGMFGGEEVGFGKRNISPAQEFDLDPNIKPQGDLRGTSLAQQIDKGASKQFDALAKGKDTASIKEVAIDTITSPTTLISGGVSLAQYIDAKKKENEDKGIEFTEEDYNNAVNEYYAQYSEGFDRGFGQTGGIAQTREKYGNGSGPSGNRLKQLYTLREEAMEKGDDDKVIELDQEIGLILKKYATGGRVQLGEGSDDPEKSQMALDMFGKDIRLLDQDEMDMLDEEYNIKKGIVELAKGGRVQLASGTAEPQGIAKILTRSGLLTDLAQKVFDKKNTKSPNMSKQKIIQDLVMVGDDSDSEDAPQIVATIESNPFTKKGMASPITEFQKNIGNAIMGIRSGMDQNIVADMLENQRIQMGIPEEDAKVAVTDFMSNFQGIQ